MVKWLTTNTTSSLPGAIWLLLWGCLLSPLAQAETLLDPTAPLAGERAAATSSEPTATSLPKLQSIILGNGPALAVLNGRSYRVGQQIDGYQLVSISADSVLLEKAGKRHSLTLFGSKIKI